MAQAAARSLRYMPYNVQEVYQPALSLALIPWIDTCGPADQDLFLGRLCLYNDPAAQSAALPVVTRLLNDTSRLSRQLLFVAGNLKDPSIQANLLRIAESPHLPGEIRGEALEAWLSGNWNEAAQRIARASSRDSEPRVRASAYRGMEHDLDRYFEGSRVPDWILAAWEHEEDPACQEALLEVLASYEDSLQLLLDFGCDPTKPNWARASALASCASTLEELRDDK